MFGNVPPGRWGFYKIPDSRSSRHSNMKNSSNIKNGNSAQNMSTLLECKKGVFWLCKWMRWRWSEFGQYKYEEEQVHETMKTSQNTIFTFMWHNQPNKLVPSWSYNEQAASIIYALIELPLLLCDSPFSFRKAFRSCVLSFLLHFSNTHRKTRPDNSTSYQVQTCRHITVDISAGGINVQF